MNEKLVKNEYLNKTNINIKLEGWEDGQIKHLGKMESKQTKRIQTVKSIMMMI